jgi:hypothetical protein
MLKLKLFTSFTGYCYCVTGLYSGLDTTHLGLPLGIGSTHLLISVTLIDEHAARIREDG